MRDYLARHAALFTIAQPVGGVHLPFARPCGEVNAQVEADDIAVFGHITTGSDCPRVHDIDVIEVDGDKIKTLQVYRNAG